MNILEVRDLRTYFYTRRGVSKAVDGVSFSLSNGEILGLVGESGCGKTVTCLSILQLVPKSSGRIVGGEIIFNGENLIQKNEKEMRKIRGRMVSLISQEPMTSLNPLFSVGYQIAEPLKIHQKLKGNKVWEKVKYMLKLVNILPAEVRMHEYPHQMSGGMRQRVSGAIALSCEAKLLIADEPTTALDVTLQAQYLNLIEDIHRKLGISIIFITHDFGIIARICNTVAVMYAGKIVEKSPVEEIFYNPLHPYTSALIKSVPNVNRDMERLYSIDGQPPHLTSLPPGCSFAPRCFKAKGKCLEEYPPEITIGNSHFVRCWRIDHE